MNNTLQQRIRDHLNILAQQGNIISYRQLAILANITGPHVINRLTNLLENILREDHTKGIQASISCLAVSQTKPLIPRAGYFILLRELALYSGSDQGAQAKNFHANCVQQVFERFSIKALKP